MPISPTHEVILLTKFHNDCAKIVEFLLVASFGLSLVFFAPVSIFKNFLCKIKGKNDPFYSKWSLDSKYTAKIPKREKNMILPRPFNDHQTEVIHYPIAGNSVDTE